MLVSLCNEVIAELAFERQCELAARLGYDGIELAPFTLGDEPHRLPAAERAKLRRIAENAGTPIRSLHYLLRAPRGLSITSPDMAQRQRTVAVMRALCEMASDLGARVLVHGSPDQRRLEPGDEAAGRERGTASFAAVAEAAEVVRKIGSPAVKTMIDCSSAALTENESVPDLIRRWLPSDLIGHIHFNDPNRRGPGDGELDFAPVLAALRASGYRHDAAVEPFIYEPDGPTCAARAIAYLRGLRGAQTP